MKQHPYTRLTATTLKGGLILTPCPGTQGTSLPEALTTLKAAGALALLTLMPADELRDQGAGQLAQHCREQGIEWFHLPVEDDKAPGTLFQVAWQHYGPRVRELLMSGADVAIHCKGGSGRTGLMAAQILIESGLPLEEAMRLVQALRPRALQLPAHLDYIQRLGDPSADLD